MTNKSMMMPQRFVADVCRLVTLLDDVELDDDMRALCDEINEQIHAKLDAMEKRKSFTSYKTAPAGATREASRQEYLGKAGIHSSWQTKRETPYEAL
jgi:hypothetical protein